MKLHDGWGNKHASKLGLGQFQSAENREIEAGMRYCHRTATFYFLNQFSTWMPPSIVSNGSKSVTTMRSCVPAIAAI